MSVRETLRAQCTEAAMAGAPTAVLASDHPLRAVMDKADSYGPANGACASVAL